jgi:4-hydroxybenzoate polyprenyltransferase
VVAIWELKNPPKRKIPKGRVSRTHHYVMKFPSDFIQVASMVNCYGFAYINLFDSFIDDCHHRIYKYTPNAPEIEKAIYTVCLN